MLEKSFPRGGVAAKKENTANAKENIIFGAVQKKLKKSKPSKSKSEVDDLLAEQRDEGIQTHSAELLSYETVQDGMIVLGMVSAVDQLQLTISLPGRIKARVTALEISEAYTKAARDFLENTEQATSYKTLQELYKVGQLQYGRVQEVRQNKHGRPEILMTLKPAEVHADLIHTNIRKGFVFNGAVEEIQEHGYIIESGIKGLRTFLPLDKSHKNLALGQLVNLKVDKITGDKTASTCICKQVQSDQMRVKTIQSAPNIDYILPSSIVTFNVTKCLKDGLQGTIMDDAFTAYVNEHQLSEPLKLPEDYEINGNYNARILYVMPLTKLVYLSLNTQRMGDDASVEQDDEGTHNAYKRGDIIENARSHHIGTGGVVLILNNKFKGLITYKTVKANYKGNYDQDELLIKYAKKTKHKVRVLDYDIMDGLYICTDDANIVNEKFFALDDVKVGDIITAVVKAYNNKIDGYLMQVGKLNGMIEKLFLAPSTKQYEKNAKIRCRVVMVCPERKTIYLTNRTEYMAKGVQLLTSIEAAKRNSIFMGTIVQSTESYHLVKFSNGIRGMLYKNQLLNALQQDQAMNFFDGQTMPFRIVNRKGTQITLGLSEDACALGDVCEATVTHVLETGLEISVSCAADDNDDAGDTDEEVSKTKGLVPLRLLTDFTDLLNAKLRTYREHTALKVACLQRNTFSVRDVAYFQSEPIKDWKAIAVGDVLRAYVKNVHDDIVELHVPIRGYSKLVKLHLKMLLLHAYEKANIVFNLEQVVYVRVVGKVESTKTISVNAYLNSVWCDLSGTASYVESYLQEIADIRKALAKQKQPISQHNIGDKLTVVFQGINAESNDWLYETAETKIMAVAKSSILAGSKLKTPIVGAKQEAIIIWIDYSNDLLYISPKPMDIKHITKATALPEQFSTAQHVNAKVLLKQENVFICSLKNGPNPLVYCPIRLHYNDFENSASADVKEGDFCKLAFIHKTKPIAVLQQTWDLWQKLAKETKRKANCEAAVEIKVKKAKRELVETEEAQHIIELETTKPKAKKTKLKAAVKETTAETQTNAAINTKAKKRKLEPQAASNESYKTAVSSPPVDNPLSEQVLFYEDTTPHNPQQKKIAPIAAKTLAGVSDFWTTDLTQLASADRATDSSDDDTEDEATNSVDKKKKKKLSTVEKFKQQREEEQQLREIEEKYADPNHLPETVDQFDRLVLSEPNKSENWINYMVFHLQSAEIDKARAVARRAIKAISMRQDNEHLNVWVALLNLEIRYGSRESFETTLKEALTYNEPVKVYLRAVEILREANKQQELLEMIAVITKKFKSLQDVWKAAANAYFSIGMTERAQQLLHKSLASLPAREHVNTIVMFANLNHRHNCNEMAQTLMDQIVTSYPKRVDVWTQYVDMLIKDKLVDSARNVLERAILQKIPLKKMRTVFKKYLEFEEKFGTTADVEKVKRLAAEYVKKNAQ